MRYSLRDINEELVRQSDAVYDVEYGDVAQALHVW